MRTIGPYRLGERLGVGAMGEVHVVASAQRLAIKTLVTDDPDTVRAFSRETRAVAQLHHRGVVTIVDHGLDDGPRYLVMERADRTLADTWPEDWDGVTDLVLQLLEGLAHVHARGLVHRDLKASNVLAFDTVSGGIRWALTDFGLAQRVGGRDGTTWGTPTSMAPEQFEGRWVDFGPPTDLYALGCLVWRAVCGAGPFTGRDAGDLAAAHLTRALPPLAPRMAVPVDLEAWLATLLRKAPEARFACAADASWAFRGLARPSGSPGSPRPLATGEPTQTAQEAWSTFPGPSASTEPPRARPAASVEEALRVLPPVPSPRGIPGTSLIATRELPTVARWEERRWLWRELLAVCRTHRARVRALMGRPGHGRRHLARWVARRAEELGTAVGIGAAADLITLAHALLRSTGVPSDALAAWVWAELERSHLAPEPQRVLARGLGVDRGAPPTRDELVGALVAWLGLRTRVRPLVVVLDTPDDELAELVAATSELPVLWLLVDAPFTAEGLTVPPLASGAQVEALQTLLPLSPELAGRLVDGTQGDVGLARRRLRGWAVRDALRPSSRGWILRSGVSALPDVASDPVAEDAESERLVLLGAAAAHGFGDYHRVLRLLDRLDPPPPEARWRRAMALCMLGDLEGAERSADAALQSASGADRIAAHRARASVHVRRGERDAAVALLEAAQHVPASGEQAIYARVELASAYVAAGRTADARRQLAIEIRGGTAASIVFDITRGRLHMGEAELEPARAAFERAMETAIGLGARTWEAIARLDLAVPLRTLQGPDAARTSCMRAVAILDQVGHVIAAASARLSLAWIDALDGESRAALAWIDEAVPRLEGVGHETLLAAARLAQLLPLAALGAWSRFDATIEAVREVTDPQHRPVLEMLEAAETLLVELPDGQRGGWVRDLRTRLDPRP